MCNPNLFDFSSLELLSHFRLPVRKFVLFFFAPWYHICLGESRLSLTLLFILVFVFLSHLPDRRLLGILIILLVLLIYFYPSKCKLLVSDDFFFVLKCHFHLM